MFHATHGYLSSKKMFSHIMTRLYLQNLGIAYSSQYSYSVSSSDKLHCCIISINN
jgi:hypothetical protein